MTPLVKSYEGSKKGKYKAISPKTVLLELLNPKFYRFDAELYEQYAYSQRT
jgi:hypothetical protein